MRYYRTAVKKISVQRVFVYIPSRSKRLKYAHIVEPLAEKHGALEVRGEPEPRDRREDWSIAFPSVNKADRFTREAEAVLPVGTSFRSWTDRIFPPGVRVTAPRQTRSLPDDLFWQLLEEAKQSGVDTIPENYLIAFKKKFWGYAYKIARKSGIYSSDIADDLGIGVVEAGKAVYDKVLRDLSSKGVYGEDLLDQYSGSDLFDDLLERIEDVGLDE